MLRIELLEVVPKPHPMAAVFSGNGIAAALRGREGVDTACGGCGYVLAPGASARSLRRDLAGSSDLLITCPRCRAFNRLICRK